MRAATTRLRSVSSSTSLAHWGSVPQSFTRVSTFSFGCPKHGRTFSTSENVHKTLADGRIYDGEWKDGQPHGVGKMTLPSSDKTQMAAIVGKWHNGKLEGRATCTRQDGVIVYDLNFVAGQIQGQGTMRLKSTGTIYQGEFKNNLPNGHGIETDKEGRIIYEGEWKDGLYEGNGKWSPPRDGAVYEGEFVAGHPHGYGVEVSEGERYEGEFKHGWYDGEGKVIQYHDKRVSGSRNEYEGGFCQGLYHGYGVLRMIIERPNELEKQAENTKQRREKIKEEDEWGLIDLNEETEESSEEEPMEEGLHIFEGQWMQGRFTGTGKVTSPDGSVHEGSFLDGMRHGRGKVTSPDGEEFEGEWEEDVLQGTIITEELTR